PEGDDGQVVAAQPQGGAADDDAGQDGRDDHRGDGGQDRPAQPGGQHAAGVGADGVERRVAQVQQPAVADDDVQPGGEHHEDHRVGHDADGERVAGDQRGDHGDHQPDPAEVPVGQHLGGQRVPATGHGG